MELLALAESTLTKAQATFNDFLILHDPSGKIDPPEAEIATVCLRRGGFGADGFIRAVHCLNVPGHQTLAARWFMDYRNADGSAAEMCGNGIRAFVEYLRNFGHITLEVGESIAIGTRGGVRTVSWDGTWYQVDMGPAFIHSDPVEVKVPQLRGTYEGVSVDMPNPHVVIWVDAEQLVDAELPAVDPALALPHRRPAYDPIPENGTNLELVHDLSVPGANCGHIALRVLERGVGETASCGTGCCAAAVATAHRVGEEAPSAYLVDVPGGELRVEIGPTILLSGPAEIIGTLTCF